LGRKDAREDAAQGQGAGLTFPALAERPA
jgi:hypothetical protein